MRRGAARPAGRSDPGAPHAAAMATKPEGGGGPRAFGRMRTPSAHGRSLCSRWISSICHPCRRRVSQPDSPGTFPSVLSKPDVACHITARRFQRRFAYALDGLEAVHELHVEALLLVGVTCEAPDGNIAHAQWSVVLTNKRDSVPLATHLLRHVPSFSAGVLIRPPVHILRSTPLCYSLLWRPAFLAISALNVHCYWNSA